MARTAMKSDFHVPVGSIGDAHAIVTTLAMIVNAMNGLRAGRHSAQSLGTYWRGRAKIKKR